MLLSSLTVDTHLNSQSVARPCTAQTPLTQLIDVRTATSSRKGRRSRKQRLLRLLRLLGWYVRLLSLRRHSLP